MTSQAPSPAFADIGPSTPPLREIQRRADMAMEFAKLARDRAQQGDVTHAMQWLDRVRNEATFGGSTSE